MDTAQPVQSWQERNQAVLAAQLARLKACLAGAPDPRPAPPVDPSSALGRLVEAFGLSSFEQDVLLLCAGLELDADFPALCSRAQADPSRNFPCFSLALSHLPRPHYGALALRGPLRHWRLIEPSPGAVLARASLRIDERVLFYLLGVGHLDERLTSLLNVLPPADIQTLPLSLRRLAEQVAGIWENATRGRDLTLIQLSGPAADSKLIAAAVAGLLGLRAAILPADRLPQHPAELETLLRLWDREAILSSLGVLLLETNDERPAPGGAGHGGQTALDQLLERAQSPILLRTREPRRVTHRPSMVFELQHPSAAEQRELWRARLPAEVADATLTQIVGQFSLPSAAIESIAAECDAGLGHPSATDLWRRCRMHLRSALEGLARRVETQLDWDDLILPAPQKATLQAMAAQLRQRATVYAQWGFAAKSSRGLGLSALFHGPSGTGKTMAAEVLASTLQLDLYHIDLSHIVSKYIGETEANLRRIFDAAQENGAILLFDEADALFGTRSEVKDSHDRYANIEVSYLLQRMEEYRGLAILTTNMRAALDPAFMRRIRFAVAFPFPDAAERAEIWRRVFPPEAPVQDLNPERLAQLRIPGGNIRNIALNAAFLAADAGEPIQMRHLRAATLTEYAKLDRRLATAEAAAWA